MKNEQGQNNHHLPGQWFNTKAKNKRKDLGASKSCLFQMATCTSIGNI